MLLMVNLDPKLGGTAAAPVNARFYQNYPNYIQSGPSFHDFAVLCQGGGAVPGPCLQAPALFFWLL